MTSVTSAKPKITTEDALQHIEYWKDSLASTMSLLLA